MAEPLYPAVEEREKRPLGFDAVAGEAAGDPKSYTVEFTSSDDPKKMAEDTPRAAEGAGGSEEIKLLDRKSEEEKVGFCGLCACILALDFGLCNCNLMPQQDICDVLFATVHCKKTRTFLHAACN